MSSVQFSSVAQSCRTSRCKGLKIRFREGERLTGDHTRILRLAADSPEPREAGAGAESQRDHTVQLTGCGGNLTISSIFIY